LQVPGPDSQQLNVGGEGGMQMDGFSSNSISLGMVNIGWTLGEEVLFDQNM